MTSVEETRLAALRIHKAMTLISQLRDSYRELNARYALVETHNQELQELLDKVSADQSVVDEAIASALDSLETISGDFESFGTLDLDELEEAEDFTLDGSIGEELETFEELN